MLRIEHLKKDFGDVHPLVDINCEVKEGDVIAIIGPSGCGKSTFLNCINRLIEPSGGKIFLNDKEITEHTDLAKLRMRVGMVFQSFYLFSHLSILENVMFPPIYLKKKNKKEMEKRAMELLKKVGLESKANFYPEELSGGQQQRVAICRSLAMEPDILMLDEPTSALDPTMVSEVETVIRNLAQTGLTMLIVTHEMNFARTVANRIFFLDGGYIYEEGTPEEIFDHPKKERTQWFIHRMKVFELEVQKTETDIFQMQSKITAFLHGHMVPHRIETMIQLVFEELGFMVLLPHVFDGESMSFRILCMEDGIEIAFDVPGTELLDGGLSKLDALSKRIIENAIDTESFSSIYRDGINYITMRMGGKQL